jgi:TonB-linked SusC/RagA family outer membrane protein
MRSKYKWIFTLLVALFMQFSYAQEKTITGVVSDASGPLPGVNVVVKGTQRGVQTNFDGTYSIKAKVGETLVFSFLGAKDASRVVGTASAMNVTLQDGTRELETVVVTSVGIKKRQDAITSPNQIVKAKELTQAANPNLIQSLAGKVSGLQVNTVGNGVNADTRIVLRGNRSISGNNQALVVIDGAISSAALLGQLPPETIETFNIIKGAQGGALYGEQGSNGVIIVTTKKGNASNKMSVSLNSSTDFVSLSFLPKRQTSYGQGWYSDQNFSFGASNPRDTQNFVPFENGAWGPAFDNPNFVGTNVPVGLPQADGSFFTTEWKSLGSDNIKDFFQTGLILQNGITLNVGEDNGYVLFNASRQTTDFIVNGDGLKRSNFLLKAGKRFNKFSIDGSINYVAQSVGETDSTLFGELIQAATNIPIGRFANSGHQGHWTVYAKNPYETSKQSRIDNQRNVFNGIATLGYVFNKNISVNNTANFGYTAVERQQHNDGVKLFGYKYDFSPYSYAGGPDHTYDDLGGGDIVSDFHASQSTNKVFYNDLILNFDYNLSSALNLKLNLGNNIQDAEYRITEQGGNALDAPGFYHITNVTKPDNPSTLDNRVRRLRRVGGFANLDLAFKDYLYFNATGRLEQTSTVKGSFFYPSAGISFIPTKAFAGLKDNSVLSYAKISASIVQVGNTSPVRPYDTSITGTSPQGFPFGSLNGIQFNRDIVDPNVKPEFITTKEVSVNLGFFKDRVTLEGSYYIADTKDLITTATTSRTIGGRGLLSNIGTLQNKGFELDLGLTPIKTESFTWSMKGSYSTSKTIVKSLAEGATSVNVSPTLATTAEPGNPLNFLGIFAEVGEEFPLIKGTAYTRDPNGNVIVGANGNPITTSTFEKLGKVTPDYIIGFTNTISYKGLQLTAVADYRTGHQFYSATYNQLATFGYLEESANFDRSKGYVFPNSVQLVAGNYVANTTPVGGTANYTGVGNYYTQNFNRTGESQILDATAFKIKEIALSYSLPIKLIEKTGLQSFRIGINARNPFVKLSDSNKGYADPESSYQGDSSGRGTTTNGTGIANVGQYPSTKSYGFSLNLTF